MLSDAEIAKTVSRAGWHAIAITDCRNPYVYTCGLMTTFRHPELVIFHPDPQAGYAIIAVIVEDIRNGRTFIESSPFGGVLVSGNIATRQVHSSQHEFYLGYALEHCRHMGLGELRVLQVFWPDTDGRFPFERASHEEVWQVQPRLDQQLTCSEIRERREDVGS